MLSKESLDGQNASAGALCNISFNSSPAVKESIVKAGALPPLVRLLASVARHVPAGGSPDKPAAAELAARCVWNLASGSDANRQMIARVGGVGALVLAVKDGPPRMQAIAAGALSHLAVDDNLKDDIRSVLRHRLSSANLTR